MSKEFQTATMKINSLNGKKVETVTFPHLVQNADEEAVKAVRDAIETLIVNPVDNVEIVERYTIA